MGFARQVFRHSKDDVWRALCHQIGAEFVKGGFWKGESKIRIHVNKWTITLDSYTISNGKTPITYTRMRAPYVNKDGFRFRIYRHGLFSELGKYFGMQDIDVGDSKFDRDFIIKGNDESKVRELFANTRIRQLIQAEPSIRLQVKDDDGWFGANFPEGVDELNLEMIGMITDIEHVRQLYELFAETLNHLCHIGSAYEDDPALVL